MPWLLGLTGGALRGVWAPTPPAHRAQAAGPRVQADPTGPGRFRGAEGAGQCEETPHVAWARSAEGGAGPAGDTRPAHRCPRELRGPRPGGPPAQTTPAPPTSLRAPALHRAPGRGRKPAPAPADHVLHGEVQGGTEGPDLPSPVPRGRPRPRPLPPGARPAPGPDCSPPGSLGSRHSLGTTPHPRTTAPGSWGRWCSGRSSPAPLRGLPVLTAPPTPAISGRTPDPSHPDRGAGVS